MYISKSSEDFFSYIVCFFEFFGRGFFPIFYIGDIFLKCVNLGLLTFFLIKNTSLLKNANQYLSLWLSAGGRSCLDGDGF